MGFGPVQSFGLDVLDMTPPSNPGAPTLIASQLSNVDIECRATVPVTKENGDPADALQTMIISMATTVDDTNPFIGVLGSLLEQTAIANGGQSKIQDLTVADVGVEFSYSFSVIEIGKKHWFAASVSDGVV